MMVKWDDVKNDYAKKDAEIKRLKEKVELLKTHERSMWALDVMEKLHSMSTNELNEYLDQQVQNI